ncbi:hypothetical protein M407DRAFT_130789 [Tulasnella calospora MUT 4182]|uniref:Uncharacterized protein n=1 Tax=Tulasnella calospora MUT 4182 TaxID=1051891 RepID=A0A0C3PZR4_9AGAM|nr:hypothetical protein M407DRAFT_130789 [Tulasnella calospora MUT 4182]
MSNYTSPTINHLALGELSRRKLHMVSMLPSDTLRRAVLIHNIVRSTASLPPSPTSPTIITHQSESQSEAAYDYYPSAPEHHFCEDSAVEAQAEINFREAAAATTADAGSDTDMFVFPSAMTSSAQEQVWLDSLLDDLEDDGVHVSVVEADDEGSEGEVEDTYPLFATAAASCTSAPPPSSPHVSPSLRPVLPYRHQQSAYSDPSSPPRSPPELDANSFSDDDDDEDYLEDSDGENEAITPSSSTELGSSDSYFFGPPPFRCHFQPIN